MEQHSDRGQSKAALYVMVLAVLLVIAAVVLLANGQRNLRRLFGDAFVAQLFRNERPAEIRRRDVKTRRLAIPPFYLPQRYFSEADIPSFSAFMRRIAVPAEQFCAFLDKNGLINQGWQQGAMASRSYECPSEQRLPDNAPVADSLFVDVKGDESGAIWRVRLKLYLPLGENRKLLTEKAAAIVENLAQGSGWAELGNLTARFAEGREFTEEAFGLRLKFSPEVLNANSYNILFFPVFETPGARNYYTYFLSKERWLPFSSTFDPALDSVFRSVARGGAGAHGKALSEGG